MRPLSVVVTVDPEGLIILQLPGRDGGSASSSKSGQAQSSCLRVEMRLSTSALSYQKPLADMLTLIPNTQPVIMRDSPSTKLRQEAPIATQPPHSFNGSVTSIPLAGKTHMYPRGQEKVKSEIVIQI
jgi:hypothetical protein